MATRGRPFALLVLLALLALLAAALVVTLTGGDDDATATGSGTATQGEHPIRIGAKNFTEQAILGELYRGALQAKGYEVVLKSDVGSTEIIHRALRRGSIDMYPEYVGVLLSEVAELRQRPRSPSAAYAAAQAYEQRNGFALLEQTPFSDTNALGVKPAYAKRHGLRTIADLRRLRGTVRIAALPEFATRFEGLEGLEAVYGLRNLRAVPVRSGERYAALDSGKADVASVFTTEGQLAGSDYVVLSDPRGLFASGHVAPIVSPQLRERHGPDVHAAINAVTRTLTTSQMRRMNAAVDQSGRAPAAVAAEFLRAQGLV
ncbi:MAG: glycine betaine ABC transporter substrate-binding protein [Solirubrobacteraceae bacterium]|nr:glycine betaine ABC transporter substrate-binding protein [Solirubrobacteraceae bacterium]